MLSTILAQVDEVLAAPDAETASRAFFATVQPLGASYLQTRVYSRPAAALTPASHWKAGGFVTRIAPDGWPRSDAFKYVCFECNPLLVPIREGRTRYRFGDFAPRHEKRFGRYWDALGEAAISEALCATSYGEGGRIASLHLGFADADAAEAQALSLQLAGLMLTEKLISLVAFPPSPPPALTPRELDSLSFVAEGKTDWEISVILGVSEATARFHVDNARRKLNAVTRAQAVARLALLRLI
jgi:LuxR family transcriptional regulator, quorum-sensing system regulator BjaR1